MRKIWITKFVTEVDELQRLLQDLTNTGHEIYAVLDSSDKHSFVFVVVAYIMERM